MESKVDQSDYVWVIVERSGHEENFLGLADEDGGHFIPVTAEKDQCQALLGRLPEPEHVERSVEAINKIELGKQARSEGFAVYLVDSEGKVLERLAGGGGP